MTLMVVASALAALGPGRYSLDRALGLDEKLDGGSGLGLAVMGCCGRARTGRHDVEGASRCERSFLSHVIQLRTLAVRRSFSLPMASTSSALLIEDRPWILNCLAVSYRWCLEALALTPPAVLARVDPPPAA